MQISGNDFVFEFGNASVAQEHNETAAARKDFYHYTNLETLLKILSSCQLKFNRIDYMNDQKEKTYFPEKDISKLFFISSFTYEENENIPIWHMYTKDSYGVRIGFHLKQGPFKHIFEENKSQFYKQQTLYPVVDLYPDWLPTISQGDIIYVSNDNDLDEYNLGIPKNDDLLNTNTSDSKYLHNLTALAIIKNEAWKFESESRVILILRTTHDNVEIPSLDYLLVPFKLEKIGSISITFNPWVSEEIVTYTDCFIKSHFGDNACKFHLKRSKFEGVINRK